MSDDELKAMYQRFMAELRVHIRADYARQREAGIDRTTVWKSIRGQHRKHQSYLDTAVAQTLSDLTKREHAEQ